MSSSVCVLTPNGRRQTVKCMPNKTIMQIIEEVCTKHGFKPEEYDIKHHNKIIDTTLSFRFSGLPNNAQLELVTATKTRIDSEVVLAINLENGSRVMGNFLPDETLWNILEKLCPNDIAADGNNVVVYMRNEIYGNALETTTLRTLGLRGGRAMVRLLHKSPEDLKAQANVSAPLPSKPVEEKPYHRVLKQSEEAMETSDVSKSESISKQTQKKTDVDFLKLAREKRKLETQPVIQDIEPLPPKSKQKFDSVKKHQKEESMEVDSNQNEQKIEENTEESFVFLGERNAMLFSLDAANCIPSESLPDDFFELTIDDAKKILGDIRRKRTEMDNANLMTAAMRNLEESKKQLRHLSKYKKSIIRIQFPDRSILQGTFTPSETVKDVEEFVREYLESKSNNFYLYTTPPKSILKNDNHLIEIGCVPGALLHLGTDSANKSEINLRADLHDKFTTNSVASLAASKMRKDNTKNQINEFCMEQEESNESINTPGPSSQQTSYERKVLKSTEKVPKWFKPCK